MALSLRLLHRLALALALASIATAQTAATQPGASSLASAHTVYLDVRNAPPPASPASEATLTPVRPRAERALRRWTWVRETPDRTQADLILQGAVDEHYRYGFYHSQIAPAIFLRVLDPPTGKELYCGWHRAGFLHSATSVLFDELRREIEQHDRSLAQPPTFCGAEGQRPATP